MTKISPEEAIKLPKFSSLQINMDPTWCKRCHKEQVDHHVMGDVVGERK